MSHVFISYSKKNQSYARQLAEKLKEEGFDVWIDDRIDYGDTWERVIFKAIDDCSAFLVIMTPESYESRWVLRECQHAENRNKPAFPVLRDGQVFPRYNSTQYVDVRSGQLPPPNFYDKLEKHVLRDVVPGSDVTEQLSTTPVTINAEADATPPPRYIPDTPRQPPQVTISEGEHIPWTPIAPPPKQPEPKRFSGTILAAVGAITLVTIIAVLVLAKLNSNYGQIAFVSNRDGNPEIYVMNADGTNQRNLSQISAADDYSPGWTPDGNQIAFHSNRDGNFEIYVMNADGSNIRRLTQNSADDYFPVWSPDGNQIAFYSNRDGNFEIYVMNGDGGNVRQLTDNSAFDAYPAWSPDDNLITFFSDRDGNFEIYVMNADDGSFVRRLTQNSADNRVPEWSPDGSQIVFASNRDGNDEIYVMNADGGNVLRLTQNPGDDFAPNWSPDGSQIVFHSDKDGNIEIYVMNADGSNIRRLTNNEFTDRDPVWRPAP
jgi:Tol biopolymer transport system component